jgi:hypothetical protein
LADFLDSSPLKLFGQMNRNLLGSIYGKSPVMIAHFVPIHFNTEPSIGASHQISSFWQSTFREDDFLEIDQSKTRISCGSHVC